MRWRKRFEVTDGGVESLMRAALERLTRNSWEKAS
jgi:hypothetical protein